LIVILADTHFGRTDPAAERAKEIELVACLNSLRDEASKAPLELILLGDIYDSYIEYATLMPKGFSRFLGLLGQWSDAGVAIRYFAGNHDPWHRDFFRTEFGALFFPDHEDREIYGRRFRFVHGDGIAPGGLYRRLKPILRHYIPVTLYRTLLPGDLGLRLACWVNERFSAKVKSFETVEAIRNHATELLQNGTVDVFVAGHSHHAEHRVLSSGTYLNPGSWHYERTFATIDHGEITLLRSVGGTIVDVSPEVVLTMEQP
jgi:UDP-2,3-diacylglucosamine hydrolase